MPIQTSRWAEERRAYYRLLRHLLSEEVQSAYAAPRAQPLPERLGTLLDSLERDGPQENH